MPGAEGGGCRGSRGTALPLGECAVTSMSCLLGAPRINLNVKVCLYSYNVYLCISEFFVVMSCIFLILLQLPHSNACELCSASTLRICYFGN